MIRKILMLTIVLFCVPEAALAAKWNPVTGADLAALFSGTVLKGNSNGERWVGQYCSDGTGILTRRGKDRERSWKQEGEDKICMTSKRGEKCYTFFQQAKKPNRYKFKGEGSVHKVTLTDKKPEICE